MSLPLIIFSHGNSFPASTYKVMLNDLRNRGFEVQALEKLGHDPKYPVTNNWPHLVEQLSDFVEPLAKDQPVILLGHSLGGFLSVMTAAKHPEWVKGVVMLDAPLVAGWLAHLLRFGKRLPGREALSPAATSRKRRTQWADEAEAFAHFAGKKAFAKWHGQVLEDYITYGTHTISTPEGSKRVLSFDRDIESAIYNTLPDHIESYLKRHPLKCKAALIGGLASKELKQVGLHFSRRITKGRIHMVDGTHLFPMEYPHVTAASVEAAVLGLIAE